MYDVAPLQNNLPVFETLSTTPGLFECVRVDAGGYGVVWNDELDLAWRLMPSEQPEPGDLEAIGNYIPRERFSFTSAKEIADYFGIAE
jgi:hypothetical protein